MVTLSSIGNAGAEDSEDPRLVVKDPFTSVTAIANLRSCIDVSDEEAVNLGRLRKLSYHFDSPGGVKPVDDTTDVVMDRQADITLDNFGSTTVTKLIEDQRRGWCETDIKIGDISVTQTGFNRVAAKYHARADFRDCGWIFGVHYENDVGSAWGDVSLVYGINEQNEIELLSQEITNTGQDKSPFYEALELISNVIPAIYPQSIALSVAIKSNLPSTSGSYDPEGAMTRLMKDQFMALAAGVTSIEAFTKRLDKLRPPVLQYKRVPMETGLQALDTTTSVFRYTESTHFPSDLGVESYDMKVAEIKLLEELKLPSDRRHTVQLGENLWTIAAKYYSDPKLYLFLEDRNELKGKPIWPGEQIIVPLMTELCAAVRGGTMVLPGDTLWGLRAKYAGYKPSVQDFRSGILSLIYPYERLRRP